MDIMCIRSQVVEGVKFVFPRILLLLFADDLVLLAWLGLEYLGFLPEGFVEVTRHRSVWVALYRMLPE